jgi:hypothetical protein
VKKPQRKVCCVHGCRKTAFEDKPQCPYHYARSELSSAQQHRFEAGHKVIQEARELIRLGRCDCGLEGEPLREAVEQYNQAIDDEARQERSVAIQKKE